MMNETIPVYKTLPVLEKGQRDAVAILKEWDEGTGFVVYRPAKAVVETVIRGSLSNNCLVEKEVYSWYLFEVTGPFFAKGDAENYLNNYQKYLEDSNES